MIEIKITSETTQEAMQHMVDLLKAHEKGTLVTIVENTSVITGENAAAEEQPAKQEEEKPKSRGRGRPSAKKAEEPAPEKPAPEKDEAEAYAETDGDAEQDDADEAEEAAAAVRDKTDTLTVEDLRALATAFVQKFTMEEFQRIAHPIFQENGAANMSSFAKLPQENLDNAIASIQHIYDMKEAEAK